MNSEQDRHLDKISYEKPTAVDLGPTAPVVGASCVTGDKFDSGGHCVPLGNSAGNICQHGNSAGTCGPGSDGVEP